MIQSQRSPIGVFDSGVGGLTVLRELNHKLPHESILYFGDTARLPYGTRSKGEIIGFVREILSWMTDRGVKMVVMACNTSSALALEEVRDEFRSLPVLGVILPGAKSAVRCGRRIGVIATQATVQSDAYRRAILEIEPTASVWQVACPEFVPLIEQNRIHDPYTLTVAQEYLRPLLRERIDTLVYGCTHYRHLSPVFQKILSPAITRIDPAQSVVKAIEKELALLGLKNSHSSASVSFAVSGCPSTFAALSRQWLGFLPTVEKVYLPVSVKID
ncbi:MAG: Glutamate racemase [Chroococcopsis gigantea SAG 12.99]|jgi:glutamate racemase|nr:glutamate racemase [Chlorogloea purpurea SAG 13.99]MDV3002239.1 Glutamate racemase [Chroococcopsis gigantea SAG 12.99]